MGRPRQRTMRTVRQYRPSLEGFALPIGISFLLLFPGCAQLDQPTGKQAGADESAPTAPTQGNRPVKATEPAAKPAAKKKADESHQANIAKESRPQTPSHAPAHPTAPVEGLTKQPEPASKQPEQDKALAEKDKLKKENTARVATDKKLRKSPKSQAEAQPPTDDVFLSPIPLPSKPAAIGGSGG